MKRKTKKIGWCRVGANEIESSIFEYLATPKGLSALSSVNKHFKYTINQDNESRLWEISRNYIWEDKSYVVSSCREIKNARIGLYVSIQESRRTQCTVEEIGSLRWWFRFKSTAGRAWTQDDPYWLGHEAAQLRFIPPQSNGDRGNIITITENNEEDPNSDRWQYFDWSLEENEISMLLVQNNNFPQFPKARLVRHPHNWGLIFTSPWVVFASFPLRASDKDAFMSDRNLSKFLLVSQWDQVGAYNRTILHA